MSIIPALRRQEELAFKTILGYIGSSMSVWATLRGLVSKTEKKKNF
jgi:hypothetical protein